MAEALATSLLLTTLSMVPSESFGALIRNSARSSPILVTISSSSSGDRLSDRPSAAAALARADGAAAGNSRAASAKNCSVSCCVARPRRA